MFNVHLFVILAICIVVSNRSSARIQSNLRRVQCSGDEFRCSSQDQCIGGRLRCDGQYDCNDGSDERYCTIIQNEIGDELLRDKRQTDNRRCGTSRWRCHDGKQCITVDRKCDGSVDCKDGSDESFALCRTSKCPSFLFRCAYGACVDGTAKCNKVQECADNSDELNLDCVPRNVTGSCGLNFECNDGQCIPQYGLCDGEVNCRDGSDETVLQCGLQKCPTHLFRCAYGACVDGDANCDGVKNCADGSDENWILCGKEPPASTTTTTTTTTTRRPTRPTKPTESPEPTGGGCIVPPRSAGNYRVEPDDSFGPGEEVPPYTAMTFDCGLGAGLTGDANLTICLGQNIWEPEAKCKRKCRMLQSLTVEYTCEAPDGKRFPCDVPVAEGTLALPRCKPSYVSTSVLPALTCLEGGSWDNSVSCAPDCGTISPKSQSLIVNGRDAKHGEFPWHVGIFQKMPSEPSGWLNICGGSIVNAALVISAAHCFYVEALSALNPPEQYAVGAGKIYRSWDSSLEDPQYVQKSNVKQILIPEFYGGITRHYQADLALLVLETYLSFSPFVKPVCINFEGRLEQLQLIKGAQGKVAGWGLLAEDGNPSEVLKTANLPFVDYPDCVASLPDTFQPFLLTDKICAGWTNGTAVCKGDSGGGLVFARSDETGIVRYYLRGLVSNSPLNDAKTSCRSDNYAAFTKVSSYADFVNEIWSRHQPR